jgi:transposase
MRDTAFFSRLLQLAAPWKVERVVFSPESELVDVFLQHRRRVPFACPECRLPLPIYDHAPPRQWRHLDHGGYVTWLHARLPRVYCLEHGLRRVLVPWALPEARFTTAFEKHAIDVLLETNIEGGSDLLRISWDEAWNLMERAVVRGQKAKQRRIIARLGVDEKAVARRHQYVTLVCDLDKSTVEYVADDRRKTSLDAYYRSLTRQQLAGIEAVAMDMWQPFVASTIAHVPHGEWKIVFDRYHIMAHMIKAVDQVRRREHRLLQGQGDQTLTGTRYLWLFSEENLPEDYEEWFELLRQMHLHTGRAWAIKEALRHLWDYQRLGWARRHWQEWYYWATHSRLKPIVKVAKMIKNHLSNVLTYFDHRITNATSEGLNSKIQTIKKTPTVFAIGSI